MGDLTNPKLIYAKGWLFLLCGCMSAGLLLADSPTLKTGLLIGITVWSFCRFYYFAFYVVEHYVEDSFRFAGLWHFIVWFTKSKRNSTED